MTPSRVDFVVDLAYGLLIFVAVVVILTGRTAAGVAFGLGTLVSYAIHVGWKMARFDPEWMTEQVAETVEKQVEETLTEEVPGTVQTEVAENVEGTLSEELDEIGNQLEAVNERIDRRPRTEDVDRRVEEADGRDGGDGPTGSAGDDE